MITGTMGVFILPFAACLLMTLMLGYLGIHVLQREIIFIDIALAQIAALGAVTLHVVVHTHADGLPGDLCALLATMVAAAFFAFARNRVLSMSLEAIIGVTYAVAAGATLFVLGVTPGGHTHMHELLAGSILWVTREDIILCAAMFTGVGVCLYVFRKVFDNISADYEKARQSGVHVVWWDFLFYALFGIVITWSVRMAGVVVVFGFLIIPATMAVLLTQSAVSRLGIAWLAGLTASLTGLMLSQHYDLSVGPAVVLSLGVLLTGTSAFCVARDYAGNRIRGNL